jgi:hypothetical protein
MAKASSKNGGGNSSKIRFIMLEADLADGDLTQITQAITQAVRQGQPIPRQPIAIAARSTAAMPAAAAQDDDADETAEQTEDDAQEQEQGEATASSRPRASRKFPAPKVINDLDLDAGDVSFEKFAIAKGNPKKHLKRFLLSAYWLKENRGIASVNMNHVFTCYKKMAWNTAMRDFSQPLRDLARNNTNGEFKDGAFTINLIGGGVVEKMSATADD